MYIYYIVNKMLLRHFILKKCHIYEKAVFGCLIRYKSDKLNDAEHHANSKVIMSYAKYEDDITSSVPPLIILHGLFGSKRNWRSMCNHFLKQLTPKRQVLAVDIRNHGDSPHTKDHNYFVIKEDIKHFLRSLKINEGCFLGHSMGGMAAMLYALKYPGVVNKLIIEDIAPVQYHKTKMFAYIIDAMMAIRLPSNVGMTVALSLADQQLAKKIQSRSLRIFILSNLVKMPDNRYTWRVNLPVLQENMANVVNFPQVKSEFTKPTLFIFGKKSEVFREEDLPTLKKYFPNSDVRYVEGAGHLVHADKPENFLNLCLEYLNDVK